MTEEQVRRSQTLLAECELYSVRWQDGDEWHLMASTDPKWLDMKMHQVAKPLAVLTWEPPASCAWPSEAEARRMERLEEELREHESE